MKTFAEYFAERYDFPKYSSSVARTEATLVSLIEYVDNVVVPGVVGRLPMAQPVDLLSLNLKPGPMMTATTRADQAVPAMRSGLSDQNVEHIRRMLNIDPREPPLTAEMMRELIRRARYRDAIELTIAEIFLDNLTD